MLSRGDFAFSGFETLGVVLAVVGMALKLCLVLCPDLTPVLWLGPVLVPPLGSSAASSVCKLLQRVVFFVPCARFGTSRPKEPCAGPPHLHEARGGGTMALV